MTSNELEDFVFEVTGSLSHKVEFDYGGGFVRLEKSEADLRQAAQDIKTSEDIVLELLRNSLDAHASHIFLAYGRENDIRSLVVIDDGDGIPASMHDHIFEPRVTSKLLTSHKDPWGYHGRGMALYSIAQNTQVAEIVNSKPSKGSVMKVLSDTTKLPEKTDQSTFPHFDISNQKHINVKGPKNIARIACEFAIAARNKCKVFIGSPAEIAATLYNYGLSSISLVDRVFCSDIDALPFCMRLATAGDVKEFVEIAKSLGIEISERSAQRIFNREIKEVPQLLDMIKIQTADTDLADTRKKTQDASAPMQPQRKNSIRIAKQDLKGLEQATQKAFFHIAQQYYLKNNVIPNIRVVKNNISITIPLIEQDSHD